MDEKQVECMTCHRTIPQRDAFEMFDKASQAPVHVGGRDLVRLRMVGYLCAEDAAAA